MFKNIINMLEQYNKSYPVISLITKQSKAIPLQTSTGPEGSRRLRLPDFKTIGT